MGPTLVSRLGRRLRCNKKGQSLSTIRWADSSHLFQGTQPLSVIITGHPTSTFYRERGVASVQGGEGNRIGDAKSGLRAIGEQP